MPSQKRKDVIPGELDDGSFDLSDSAPIGPDDLDEAATGGRASAEALERIAQLERELEEAVLARKRTLADFSNYQRRASENEERARAETMISVVRTFLPLLDHLALALDRESDLTFEQLLGGVRLIEAELRKTFEQLSVTEIRPVAGDEFNPNEHQAVMREDAAGQAPNSVVSILQTGYRFGELVLRPASVSVATGADAEG